MNCHEIATILEGTLLRQRNPEWLREARRHAEQCPSCARLMALHRLEEHLTELPAIEPSEVFVQTVMSRITQPEPIVVLSSQWLWWEPVKDVAIFVGALALAATYSFAAARESWLSNLWSVESWQTNPLWSLVWPIRTVGIWTYFANHPLWAVLLAGTAILLLDFGLAASENHAPKMTGPSD